MATLFVIMTASIKYKTDNNDNNLPVDVEIRIHQHIRHYCLCPDDCDCLLITIFQNRPTHKNFSISQSTFKTVNFTMKYV